MLTFVNALRDGAGQFLAGRLNDPVGYRNATAALMAMAFWPLVCLAAQRAPNPLLRAGRVQRSPPRRSASRSSRSRAAC